MTGSTMFNGFAFFFSRNICLTPFQLLGDTNTLIGARSPPLGERPSRNTAWRGVLTMEEAKAAWAEQRVRHFLIVAFIYQPHFMEE